MVYSAALTFIIAKFY
ncbi:hypothetical protein [Citrobacter amalonaticus]